MGPRKQYHVLIVDEFSKARETPISSSGVSREHLSVPALEAKHVDIDGDGIPDISHGRVVEAQLKNKAITTHRYDIGPLLRKFPEHLAIKMACEDIISKLGNTFPFFDGINFSLRDKAMLRQNQFEASLHLNPLVQIRDHHGPDATRTLINRQLLKYGYRDDLPKPLLSNSKLKPLRHHIVSPLKSQPDASRFLLEKHRSQFETTTRIEDLMLAYLYECQPKPKVTIGGGNEGPDDINIFALAEGTHIVGATNAKGQITPYSGSRALVHGYAQGTLAVTEVHNENGQLEGYDMNGDGKADISPHEVSGQGSIVKQYAGHSSNVMLATPNDVKALVSLIGTQYSDFKLLEQPALASALDTLKKTHPLFQKLYPVQFIKRLCDAEIISLPGIQFHPAQGELMELNRFFHFRNVHGTITYDPDGSGKPNAVSVLQGTSYAAPRYLKHMLLTKNP